MSGWFVAVVVVVLMRAVFFLFLVKIKSVLLEAGVSLRLNITNTRRIKLRTGYDREISVYTARLGHAYDEIEEVHHS